MYHWKRKLFPDTSLLEWELWEVPLKINGSYVKESLPTRKESFLLSS